MVLSYFVTFLPSISRPPPWWRWDTQSVTTMPLCTVPTKIMMQKQREGCQHLPRGTSRARKNILPLHSTWTTRNSDPRASARFNHQVMKQFRHHGLIFQEGGNFQEIWHKNKPWEKVRQKLGIAMLDKNQISRWKLCESYTAVSVLAKSEFGAAQAMQDPTSFKTKAFANTFAHVLLVYKFTDSVVGSESCKSTHWVNEGKHVSILHLSCSL